MVNRWVCGSGHRVVVVREVVMPSRTQWWRYTAQPFVAALLPVVFLTAASAQSPQDDGSPWGHFIPGNPSQSSGYGNHSVWPGQEQRPTRYCNRPGWGPALTVCSEPSQYSVVVRLGRRDHKSPFSPETVRGPRKATVARLGSLNSIIPSSPVSPPGPQVTVVLRLGSRRSKGPRLRGRFGRRRQRQSSDLGPAGEKGPAEGSGRCRQRQSSEFASAAAGCNGAPRRTVAVSGAGAPAGGS
jgi:hypothetical protein